MRLRTSMKAFSPHNYSATDLDRDLAFIHAVSERGLDPNKLSNENRGAVAEVLNFYLDKSSQYSVGEGALGRFQTEYKNASARLELYGMFVRSSTCIDQVREVRCTGISTFPESVDHKMVNNGEFGYDWYVHKARDILSGTFDFKTDGFSPDEIFGALDKRYSAAINFVRDNPFSIGARESRTVEQLVLNL